MKLQVILLLCLIFSSIYAADEVAKKAKTFPVGSSGYPEEKGVVVLDDSNYDESMAKIDMALVEYYAPWCGHCKALKPEYEMAAKMLKADGFTTLLVKVDAEANTKVAEKVGIEGYPTLKWYSNGEFVDYAGPRDGKGIAKWIKKKTGPPTELFVDQASIDTAKERNQVFVVFFGSEGDKFKAYQEVATKESKLVMAHVFNSELVAQYGERVVLFKEYDEGRNDLEGDFSAESLKDFLEANRYELVSLLDREEGIERIFTRGNAAMFMFQKKDGPHMTQFKTAARNLKNQMIFTYVEFDSDLGKNVSEYLAVTEKDLPCMRVIDPTGGEIAKYEYRGALQADAMTKFGLDFLAGNVERTFKTAAVPETNDAPVKVIVGSTWKEMVMNSDKDVLVEFYAPWCGHCKSLAPKYDKLAENMMRMSDKLMIAKVDSTENEVEGVVVEGFPTIKFFKAGDKTNPIDYQGAREVKAMTKFLKRKVSFTWVPFVKPELKAESTDTGAESTDTGAKAEADL